MDTSSSQLPKYLLIMVFVISLVSNVVFFLLWQKESKDEVDTAILQKTYPFIARRVLLQGWMNDTITNFLPLRQKIHQTVDPYKDSFAFYFEYLPTGTSIGINEDSEFTAASLLKVPVVMAYLYKKERLKIKGDETVSLTKNELDSHFGDLYKRGEGAQIKLSDAVKLSLQKSDNTASLVLANQISDDDFRYVYEGLDIPLALKGDSPIITAQEYTSVLKSLYFASILTNDDSQKVLALLVTTDFHAMLPSGVPTTIPIAHKIGLIDKQIYQDCGIVYVPNRPYALCMISKSDRQTAQVRMHDISKKIYEYVTYYQD